MSSLFPGYPSVRMMRAEAACICVCTALWQPNFRLLQSSVQLICREDLLDERGCIVPFATVQRPGLPDMRLQAQILNRPCAWVRAHQHLDRHTSLHHAVPSTVCHSAGR